MDVFLLKVDHREIERQKIQIGLAPPMFVFPGLVQAASCSLSTVLMPQCNVYSVQCTVVLCTV